MKYPLRLVLDAAAYADADTKVYGKVRALARGRDCEASVARLAEFTGLSVSTVEKSLTRLSRPAPTDGIAELTRRQRSHRVTGTGRTNARTYRALDDSERFVCAPVRAADALRGTLHRLYLLLRYTTLVEKREITLAEIATVLRHHGGKHAGQPLHEGTAARLLDGLEEAGWITQDKRAGYRGRHTITVHDDPVRPVDEPAPTPDGPGAPASSTPDAEGGAAPDLEGGAPAYKEDLELNDQGKSTEAGGSFRRRRDDRKWVAASSDRPVTPVVAPATFRPGVRPAGRPAYAGPPLTISPDAWELLAPVLAPVQDLLPDVNAFMTRRIVREILRQIREGIWPEDIRDQVARLRRSTEDIRDPGSWLLGAVLPERPGPCGRPDCHHGYMRHTGAPCKACADTPSRGTPARGRGHPPPTALQECPGCAAPFRPPLRHPTCRLCHTELPTGT
ncbi:hypothetical protein [Streptomyces sp. NPDC050535]|uniref:hypothetical protein n=1 Tax=Streptomyces sp. NPDC050535 TaxID=3365626 RepID=UPI0037AC77A2